MTVRNPPVWLQAGAYTAEHDRLVTGLLTDRSTDSAGSTITLEGGVVPPFNQMRVTSTGNNDMNVNITAGTVIVPRPGVDPPGAYICHNQGTTTIALQPASTSIRYDVIVARVRDSQSGETGDNWNLEVQQGVAGGSVPSTPTVAGVAVPLAVVEVRPASSNGGVNRITAAQISDKRIFISGLGGVHLTWNNPTPAPSPGRLLYSATNNTLFVGNGTSFEAFFSKNDMIRYLAAYRPSSVFQGPDISTLQTDPNWDALMRDEATGQTMSERVQISNVVTPSGLCKVTISANGRGDSQDVYANLSFQFRRANDGSLVGGDNSVTRGPNFYSTQWSSAQTSVIVQGLPIDQPCTLILYGLRSGSGNGRAYFRRVRMTAEPII